MPHNTKNKPLLTVLTVLLIGSVGGIFWLRSAHQRALADSQELLAEIGDVQQVADEQTLRTFQTQLKDAIAPLESLPKLPLISDPATETQLAQLHSQQILVEQNLTAVENLAAAKKLAWDAAVNVQNPPHPIEVWEKAYISLEKAITLLTQIPETTPVSVEAQQKLKTYQTNLVSVSQRYSLAKQAVELSNQAIQKNLSGNEKAALVDYTQAIRLNPAQPVFYINRGIVHAKLGEHTKAIQDYDQALKIDTQQAGAYLNRGLSYYYLGNQRKAVEEFNQAIQVNPNLPTAYFERGSVLYQLGEYQKGLSDLAKAAQLFSEQGDSVNYQKTQNLLKQLQSEAKTEISMSD